MTTIKKWNVLYIKDENSMFDLSTEIFNELFTNVDIVSGRVEALKCYDARQYDIIIGDLTIEPEELGLLKQIKDKKPEQSIFALVSPQDTDKLFGIADLGINAFELTPMQFDQALETIAQFNPYEKA